MTGLSSEFCSFYPKYCTGSFRSHPLNSYYDTLLDIGYQGALVLFKNPMLLTQDGLDENINQYAFKPYKYFLDFISNQCDSRWPFTYSNIEALEERFTTWYDYEDFHDRYSDCSAYKLVQGFLGLFSRSNWSYTDKETNAKQLSFKLLTTALNKRNKTRTAKALDYLLVHHAARNDIYEVKELIEARQKLPQYKNATDDFVLGTLVRRAIHGTHYYDLLLNEYTTGTQVELSKALLSYGPNLKEQTYYDEKHPLLKDYLKNLGPNYDESGSFDAELLSSLVQNDLEVCQNQKPTEKNRLFNYVVSLWNPDIVLDKDSPLDVAMKLNVYPAILEMLQKNATHNHDILERKFAFWQNQTNPEAIKLTNFIKEHYPEATKSLAEPRITPAKVALFVYQFILDFAKAAHDIIVDWAKYAKEMSQNGVEQLKQSSSPTLQNIAHFLENLFG